VSRQGGRRGATAMEFALLFPVVFVLVSGVATYSWLFLMQAGLTDAVTEGARRSASYVAGPGDDIDPEGHEQFGLAMRARAREATVAACERAGWSPSDVTVRTSLGARDGLTTLRIIADADLTSRFDGWLFPLPGTISAEIEVATMDQL